MARQAPIDLGSPLGGPEFSHVFSTTPQASVDDLPLTGPSRLDVAAPPGGPEFAQVLSTATPPDGVDEVLASAGPDEPEAEARAAGELVSGWLARDLPAVDQSLRAFLGAFDYVGERLESLLGPAYLDGWYAACGAGLSAAALALYSLRRGRDERDRGQDGALAWPHLFALPEEAV